MKCKICETQTSEVIYTGKLRIGFPGVPTVDSFNVYKCTNCGVIFHEYHTSDEFYESDSYRFGISETACLDVFNAKHDAKILEKLNFTQTDIFRNKFFMDIGCGGGGYADFINGVTRKTVLVEPNKSFADQLQKKGYEVYSYPEDALKKYENSIELITSWDVIEHISDPLQHIDNIYKLLAPGGKAYIGTPTDYPVLRGLLGAKFDAFIFLVEHPWIFSRKSLEIMAQKHHFSAFEVKFYQHYGLGNLIAWLQLEEPKGDISYNFISPQLDRLYRTDMAKEETAEYLVIELLK